MTADQWVVSCLATQAKPASDEEIARRAARCGCPWSDSALRSARKRLLEGGRVQVARQRRKTSHGHWARAWELKTTRRSRC